MRRVPGTRSRSTVAVLPAATVVERFSTSTYSDCGSHVTRAGRPADAPGEMRNSMELSLKPMDPVGAAYHQRRS
jgi:hypothetical protein